MMTRPLCWVARPEVPPSTTPVNSGGTIRKEKLPGDRNQMSGWSPCLGMFTMRQPTQVDPRISHLGEVQIVN